MLIRLTPTRTMGSMGTMKKNNASKVAAGTTFRIVDRDGVEHVGRIYANGGGLVPIVESDDSRLPDLRQTACVPSRGWGGTSVIMFTGDGPADLLGERHSVVITSAKSIDIVTDHDGASRCDCDRCIARDPARDRLAAEGK